MPNYTEVCDLNVSAEDMAALVKKEIAEWREHIYELVAQMDATGSRKIQLLFYFSLLEMMAQDEADYPDRHQQDTFTEFVLRYQTKYPYLAEVEPVTLFYHVEDIVSDVVDLSDFEEGQVYEPTDTMSRKKSAEIMDALKKKKDVNFADKKAKQHRYVDLLYRMRCRLSHEFSGSHISSIDHMDEPYSISFNRSYEKDGKLVRDDVWKLMIPVSFVKEISLNCFENKVRNQLPSKNNTMDRACELSWYSR